QAHEDGAHPRAGEVEGYVEALRAQLGDHVGDVAIALEQPLPARQDQVPDAIEVHAVHAIDSRHRVAHVGEVPLGEKGDLRLRMQLAQGRDRGGGLEQIPEPGQIDDQNAPNAHARCSARKSSSNWWRKRKIASASSSGPSRSGTLRAMASR